MSFIEMADFRLDAESGKQPPSANAEKQFLLEAQFRSAAVKFAGDSSMRGKVCRVIAVQQIKFDSPHLGLPGTQPDRVAGQSDLQAQPLTVRLAQRRDRQLAGVVVGIEGLLRSVLVNHLAKIALLVEQSHTDHRDTQVAGGFELIPRHVAKAAGVNGQRFAQHKLHAEIGRAG